MTFLRLWRRLARSLHAAFLRQSYWKPIASASFRTAQLRRLLGFETGYELDGSLKAHQVWLEYSLEDLKRDREAQRKLGF